jgi:hypothetical protein
MRISDFQIDLTDMWGRLVPGLILILDIYLLPRFGLHIDTFFTSVFEHALLTTAFLIALLLAAQILGELSLRSIFHFRKLLGLMLEQTPFQYVEKIDVTAERAVVKFFEERFSIEALEKRQSFHFCKDFLLQASPSSYLQARKMEARINLQGGILIPLVVLLGICLWRETWLIGLLTGGLLVVYGHGFRHSFSGEREFVYRAYYHWHILEEQRLHQNSSSSDH